jgi:uncharacterized protein (DUF885 family)
VTTFEPVRDAFFEHFWATHPVDASFAGVAGYDHLLPPAEADRPARERRALDDLTAQLTAAAIPDDPAVRIDAHLMRGYMRATLAQGERRPRFRNPAWYTGEIAFGVIALLLPGPVPRSADDLARRIAGIPDLLDSAVRHIATTPTPADWVSRARLERAAIERLLEVGLGLHPLGTQVGAAAIAPAISALRRFDAHIAGLPDADAAAGAEFFALLAHEVHGFTQTPAQIERLAAAEFARVRAELETAAARLDPTRTWRDQLDLLNVPDVDDTDVCSALARWHERALAAGSQLLTPATEYGLDFEPLPLWAQAVYGDLYFLFYRSPAAFAPGNGSIYWATAPQNIATLKIVHAVHHGSIGHHTQNARARSARSPVARIAGSDGASGIALLGGGSMAEGWACYAETLLAEVPDFYTPAERLLLLAHELRAIGTCLGDVRFHTGVWTLAELRGFYRDEVAFAPARIWPETTRNSMFPASRIMYWLGMRQIRALRRASQLSPKAFHNRLLSFGTAPVEIVGAELDDGPQTFRP